MKETKVNDLSKRITIRDDVFGGKPIIRNKRISAETILEFLAAGEKEEEILHQYPTLEKEDILACLQFATLLMKRKFIIQDVA